MGFKRILAAALCCAAATARAIQTGEVEVGRAGDYDGTVKIARDALGRMTFLDNETGGPVTLRALLDGADPAKGGVVTVATSGGQFDNLAAAHAAVPEGGVVLVYPGAYALAAPLVLGAKGCAFVALEAGATTIQTTTAPVIVGDATPPDGSENWDTVNPYAETGRHLFDGFTFAGGGGASISIRRANMADGGLVVRRCRFEGAKGIEATHDGVAGHSTALRVEVIGCEFAPVDHATREVGVSLCNRSRAGEAAARYRVEGNLFNTAPLAVDAPSATPATYGVGFEALGEHETSLVAGNTFLDVLESVRAAGAGDARLEARGNHVLFRNGLAGFATPFVAGFWLGGSSGDNAYALSGNRVRIDDATPAGGSAHAVWCEFGAATGNVIVSRQNEFRAAGAGTVSDIGESPATLGYAFESADDVWGVEAVAVGTFTLAASGSRKLLDLEAANVKATASLALTTLPGGGVPFAGAGGALQADGAAFHWDATNKGLNLGDGGAATATVSGTATPYQLGIHADATRDALGWIEANGAAHYPGVIMARSGGSHGAKTAPAAGQTLGALAAMAHDGTDYELAGYIGFNAGTVADNSAPADIVLVAQPHGVAQTIHSAGEVEIDKNLGVGTAEIGADGTHVLAIADGEAPTDSPAGLVQLYADLTTGTVELKVRDEAGNVTTLSPHCFRLYRPAPEDPFPFSYHSRNAYLGKEINVDLSGLVAEVERLSGKKFSHVRDLPEAEREKWDAPRGGRRGKGPMPAWLKARVGAGAGVGVGMGKRGD